MHLSNSRDLLLPLKRGASPFGEGDRLLQGFSSGRSTPTARSRLGAGPVWAREAFHALGTGIARPFLDPAFSLPALVEDTSLGMRPLWRIPYSAFRCGVSTFDGREVSMYPPLKWGAL
jgi:hypothetical protein